MASYLNFDSDSFFEETQKELGSVNSTKTFEADPDDWYPGVDKSGNGQAIIRLLPPLEGEKVSIVKWYSHNFKNKDTDRWYIENSLKSISEDSPDPVAEFNKKLWNSTTDDKHPNREQARRQKRNVNYRCNVYVVSDSANPENNGKIKKWKFGKTFFDLINLSMNPPKTEGAETERPLNPFDLIRGAELKIQIFSERRGGETRRNYSRSAFKELRGPLFPERAVLEKFYKLYQSEPDRWSLAKYKAADKFKDYDSLLKRLNYVMDMDTKTGKPLEQNNSKREEGNTEQTSPRNQRRTESKNVEDDEFNGLLETEDDIPF